MLKFRLVPFRKGSAQLVFGGSTKSPAVMLSGLTQFCLSRIAKGSAGSVRRHRTGRPGAGAAKTALTRSRVVRTVEVTVRLLLDVAMLRDVIPSEDEMGMRDNTTWLLRPICTQAPLGYCSWTGSTVHLFADRKHGDMLHRCLMQLSRAWLIWLTCCL